MHLAFVTSLVTDGKPTTGFEVANHAIVSGLRAIGCKVTEIGFRQPRQAEVDSSRTIVLKTLDVENSGASTVQKVAWMAGALVSGLPVGGSKLKAVSWPTLEKALNSLGDIDGIIINSVQMPTAFPQLMDFAPFIYVAHNVEHMSSKQNAISASGRVNRMLYQRDARLLEPIERELCSKARYVFCLSEDDRKYFDLADDRSSVLQLLFPDDMQGKAEDHSNIEISHDIGLIGTWTWQPNFVGLKWFLDEVVPHLDGGLSIAIAGGLPASVSSEHPGIKFLGRVESATDFVDQSGVLALVSRSGTGVQLKTIEAFQMGMPCCATVSSVRGIRSIPTNCMVEDDAKAFAGSLSLMAKKANSAHGERLDGKDFADQQREALGSGLRAGKNSLQKS